MKSPSAALSQKWTHLRSSGFFKRTPLIPGPVPNIFFKLDNLQPTGSFKDRGISYMMSEMSRQREISEAISSSGGNAGMAVTRAARLLGIPARVFVPVTTMPLMVHRLRQSGASVSVGGANWNEADAAARACTAAHPKSLYVPPFDDPLIWTGHSSIVSEIIEQCGDDAPDAVVVSVGGGGLLRGVQLGIEAAGEPSDVTVLAVETKGAESYALASRAGSAVRLDAITSLATSLGALSVTPAVLLPSAVNTQSVVVTDRDAVAACVRFASDRRMLVEPACGAALALAYSDDGKRLSGFRKAVVVVCGGSAVDIALLNKWTAMVGL